MRLLADIDETKPPIRKPIKIAPKTTAKMGASKLIGTGQRSIKIIPRLETVKATTANPNTAKKSQKRSRNNGFSR